MSSAKSAVLGKDITSGSVGIEKIDSATGKKHFHFFSKSAGYVMTRGCSFVKSGMKTAYTIDDQVEYTHIATQGQNQCNSFHLNM